MTDLIRVGLRTASLFTIAMVGWLAGVIVSVLPAHDPGHIPLWSVVAAGSFAFVALSLVATRPGRSLDLGTGIVLTTLSAAAVAFGLFVLGSEMTSALSGDPEGYLFGIGLILTAHGAIGLGWLAAIAVRSR